MLGNIAAVLTPLGLIWTVFILGFATFIHELAHYALARRQGVEVKSFSVGMGPVILKKYWKDTEWRISLLPMGGYVEIDGMLPTEDAKKTGFAQLPALGKIAILLAGPISNLILGLFLMTLLFSTISPKAPTAIEVMPESAAYKLGLRSGDIITNFDKQPVEDTQITTEVEGGWQKISAGLRINGKHTIIVKRENISKEFIFDWNPKTINNNRESLGIRLVTQSRRISVQRIPQAAVKSVETTINAIPLMVNSMGNLVSRFITLNFSQDKNVSGPIGTVQIVSQAASLNAWALIGVAVMLNLSLAIFNLMPIPGLDGGRILLVVVSAIKGSPLTNKQENTFNATGFIFIMMLMLFVAIRDVIRFF